MQALPSLATPLVGFSPPGNLLLLWWEVLGEGSQACCRQGQQKTVCGCGVSCGTVLSLQGLGRGGLVK
jgi:hypothetical protein